MNPLRTTIIALGLSAALSGVAGSAVAQSTITIQGCTSLTLVAGTTFACNTTVPDPTGPTGCSVAPQANSLPASGGTVTLSAGCTGGAAVSGVSWTKNGAAFGGVFPDSLPANSGTSPVTYTYTASFNWSGSPPVTASALATVAAASAPPPPPPPPVGEISCSGYSVRVVDYAIVATGNQDFSAGLNPGEIVIGRFTTPSTPDSQINLGYMYTAGAGIWRTFRLSRDACDVGTAPGPSAIASAGPSKSVLWTVSIGPGQGIELLPSTTYYFSVRGEVNGTPTCTSSSGSCGGFFQVQNP